jgi:hypothetical protein
MMTDTRYQYFTARLKQKKSEEPDRVRDLIVWRDQDQSPHIREMMSIPLV